MKQLHMYNYHMSVVRWVWHWRYCWWRYRACLAVLNNSYLLIYASVCQLTQTVTSFRIWVSETCTTLSTTRHHMPFNFTLLYFNTWGFLVSRTNIANVGHSQHACRHLLQQLTEERLWNPPELSVRSFWCSPILFSVHVSFLSAISKVSLHKYVF